MKEKSCGTCKFFSHGYTCLRFNKRIVATNYDCYSYSKKEKAKNYRKLKHQRQLANS